MNTFYIYPKANVPAHFNQSVRLGPDVNTRVGTVDQGKAFKKSLTVDSTYVLAVADDELECILGSVEPHTVNGFNFGTIQKRGQVLARNAGAGAIALGDLVVCAAQPALGTAITAVTSGRTTGEAPVAVKEGAPTKYIWEVVSLLGGAGAVGTTIVIERV